MLRLIGLIGVGLAVAVACSGSNGQIPKGPLPGGSTSQLVGPDGGTVNTLDGVTIVVPAGAVSTPTFFSVTPRMDFGPNGLATFYLPTDASFELTAITVGPTFDLGPDATTLAAPVTVTVPFDPTKVPSYRASSDVAVYIDSAVVFGGAVRSPTTLVDSTHVSTQTSVLGGFSPAVTTSSPCDDKLAPCASGQSCQGGICVGD